MTTVLIDSCERCGAPVQQPTGRGRPRKFCSDACRRDEKNYAVRCCEYCGEEYKPVRLDQRFCVKKCRGIADPFDCAYCQQMCVPGKRGVHITARKFCNPECKDLWFRSSRLAQRRRARLRERLRRDIDAASDKVRHWVAGPCAECGELFVGADHPWRPALYCSQACGKRRFIRENAEKVRAYGRASRQRRRGERAEQNKPRKRARHYGVAYEYVSREAVFERDGYRCGICGELTERDEAVPHPRSPTVDHIVPMSKGGPHLLGNLQCACFICNCRKGARTPVDTPPGRVNEGVRTKDTGGDPLRKKKPPKPAQPA